MYTYVYQLGIAFPVVVFHHQSQAILEKESYMQGFPLEQYQPVFSLVTDTASPQQPIPIYYVHSLQQPYCRNSECDCHRQQKEVAKLLGLIADGVMTLQEAVDFAQGEQVSDA